jgi:F-type H+-transporting ATPase subunit delta
LAKKAYLKRYAQAIFELALEKNEIDRWQADLQQIVALSQDAAYMSALENPKIRLEDKTKALAEKLTGVSPLALNLASLLTARGILPMAGGIAQEYQQFVDAYHGIEQAEVLTAVPLDDSDKQILVERLSALTGKKVVMKSEVDSAILGGLVARIGGKLLDGSTRTKLAALKDSLARAG